MSVTDLPAVGRLFRAIFRGTDGEASADLVDYLDAITFGSPCYDQASGSLVFAKADGSISSALLTIPITFVICDRTVTGRLLCAFMTQSDRMSRGAGALSLAFRAKHQHFSYTDTASPTSMRHFSAVGGVLVPLQNLGWVRTFRPVAATLDRLSRRLLCGRGRQLVPMTHPLDRMLRARRPRMAAPAPAPGLAVEPMSVERFLEEAPGFVAHYAIRPLWSPDELRWLLDMAQQNRGLGPLVITAVTDASRRRIGCFVYYRERTRFARVLNVLAVKGREADVLGAMFHTFDKEGFWEASGRAQPALAEGLALQPMLTFHHEAFACVISRYPDVVAAVQRGDIYIGGLAGEGWSRLMSDFGSPARTP